MVGLAHAHAVVSRLSFPLPQESLGTKLPRPQAPPNFSMLHAEKRATLKNWEEPGDETRYGYHSRTIVRAKTYTFLPEMIFTMWFRAMLRKNLITHAACLRARG